MRECDGSCGPGCPNCDIEIAAKEGLLMDATKDGGEGFEEKPPFAPLAEREDAINAKPSGERIENPEPRREEGVDFYRMHQQLQECAAASGCLPCRAVVSEIHGQPYGEPFAGLPDHLQPNSTPTPGRDGVDLANAAIEWCEAQIAWSERMDSSVHGASACEADHTARRKRLLDAESAYRSLKGKRRGEGS